MVGQDGARGARTSGDLVIPGDRVRVRIATSGGWASGAVESMNGLDGTVAEVRLSGQVFVRFDEPARPWWQHQTPPRGYHFDVKELDLIES